MARRVLIVDDHQVVRDGLERLLDDSGAWSVVGTAATGEQALREALRTQPDVVLLDFRLPDIRGDEVCRTLRSSMPDLVIIMLTSYGSDGAFRGTMEAGANAYVTKTAGFSALMKTLDDACAEPGGQHDLRPDVEPPTPERVTAQDRHLLELAARGLSDRQIARTVHLAESTIRFHMQKLKKRLGAPTKTALVAKAIRDGHISLGGEEDVV